MSSKWHIVGSQKTALGEKQLDGGVGGQMSDAAFDQPHGQTSPNFLDNAQNSGDQGLALQKWVTDAQQLRMQGASDEEIAADLAGKGCPDPQSVLQMLALTEEQGGQPLTDMPTAEQDVMPAAPADVQQSAQQQALARLRQKRASDPWGTGLDSYSPYQGFPQMEDDAVGRLNAHPDTADKGGWTATGVADVYRDLKQMGLRPETLNRFMNELIASVWEEGHATGQNEYYGETPPAGHGEGGTAYAKTADYDGHWKPGDKKHLKGDGEKNDKANEIYHAIQRDKVGPKGEPSKDEKSEAAAEANAAANKFEKKKDKGDDDKPKKKETRYQGIPGKVVASWQDMWRDGEMVRFATEYGEFDVPASDLETHDVEFSHEDPLGELEAFMVEMEPLQQTPQSVQARTANLKMIEATSRNLLLRGDLSVNDQMRADAINLNARLALSDLREIEQEVQLERDADYIEQLPSWEMGHTVVPQESLGGHDGGWLEDTYQQMVDERVEAPDLDEEAALFVDQVPEAALADQGVTQQMAVSHIAAYHGADVTSFVQKVEQGRRARLASLKQRMAKQAAAETYDGPDEALFL